MPFFRGYNPLLGYWRQGCEHPTAAEASIEPAIAALGERYRHQYPFWGFKYFADFALLDRKVIIEVDGDSHASPEQKEKDLEHTLRVLELGWQVVRVTNEQALQDPAAAVKAALMQVKPAHDTMLLEIQLRGQLALLHQNHPRLLAARAKMTKQKTRRALKAARTRRERAEAGVYGATGRRKHVARAQEHSDTQASGA